MAAIISGERRGRNDRAAACAVDDAIPNHHRSDCQNLVRLAVITGDENCRSKADALSPRIAERR